MVDVKHRREFEGWLKAQPREVSVVIAARAVWRVWPLMDIHQRGKMRERILDSAIILPLSRASASSLLAVKSPIEKDGKRAAADATAYATAFIRAAAVTAAVADEDATTATNASAYARATAATNAAYADVTYATVVAIASTNSDAAVRAAAFAAAVATATAATLESDVDAIIGGMTAATLADQPLWPQGVPDWLSQRRAAFERDLLALNEGWEVWIDWYAAMLRGGPRFQDAAFAKAINDLALWEGTPAKVNARIAKLVEEERKKSQAREALEPVVVSKDQLLSVASPKAIINASGKVDAAPNVATDKPIVDAELSTLPLRQLAIITTILKSLGRNAPESLKGALRSYSGELKIRGVQPILGLLSDMFAIVDADCNARDADEWIIDGIREAFARFSANHDTFMQHFPLSAERENVFNLLKQDEAHAPGQDARDAMQGAVDAANSAVKAGIADQNLADVLGQHQEALEVVISTPPTLQEIGLNGAERIGGTEPIIPANFRKRVIASVAGFALSIMALAKREPLGLTANLIQVLESTAFANLAKRASELWQAIAPFIGMV